MTRWGTACICGWSAESYGLALIWEAFNIHCRLFPEHIVFPPYDIEDVKWR